MLVLGPGNYPDRGSVELYGECRNMNDHRRDNQIVDITGEITGS
jgi:hypothetical protein